MSGRPCTRPASAARRPNPLGAVHVRRRLLRMWSVTLHRFRDHINANRDNPQRSVR
jgi:hypothetical protein